MFPRYRMKVPKKLWKPRVIFIFFPDLHLAEYSQVRVWFSLAPCFTTFTLSSTNSCSQLGHLKNGRHAEFEEKKFRHVDWKGTSEWAGRPVCWVSVLSPAQDSFVVFRGPFGCVY